MLEYAGKYARKFQFSPHLVLGDAVALPFRDGSFDFALSVATYHHIQGKEERQQAFRELYRVLRPGGEAFITVWNRWQPRFLFRGKETMVPWRLRDGVVYRYFYLYRPGELEAELRRAGFHTTAQGFPFLRAFFRNITVQVAKGPG